MRTLVPKRPPLPLFWQFSLRIKGACWRRGSQLVSIAAAGPSETRHRDYLESNRACWMDSRGASKNFASMTPFVLTGEVLHFFAESSGFSGRAYAPPETALAAALRSPTQRKNLLRIKPCLQAVGQDLRQRHRAHLGLARPAAASRRDRDHRGQELSLQGPGRDLKLRARFGAPNHRNSVRAGPKTIGSFRPAVLRQLRAGAHTHWRWPPKPPRAQRP